MSDAQQVEQPIEAWAEQGKRPDWRKHRRPEQLPGATTAIAGRLPPADSSYRCQGTIRNGANIGQQCSRWAVRGGRFCPKHGGCRENNGVHHRRTDRTKRLRRHHRINDKALPEVYSKYLSNKLTERLEELAGVPDELDLTEELRLMRSVAVDAAQLYDVAINVDDAQPGALEMRMSAGEILRDAIDGVGQTVERVIKAQKDRRETLTVQSLHVVVTQIVERMYDELGDSVDPQIIRRLADSIRDVRLPSDEIQGTALTPDQDAREMDATIPDAPPESLVPRIAEVAS